MLLGNYNGTPSKYVTPLQGIKNKINGLNKTGRSIKVVYDPGCNLVEEGNVIQYFNEDMFSFEGKSGLHVEFFKNNNINEKSFYSRVDHITGPNWIYSTKRPSFKGYEDVASARWSGILTIPTSGDYNFIIKSDGIYKLLINNEVILQDSLGSELTTKNTNLILEAGKRYNFKLEYFDQFKASTTNIELGIA